VAVSYQAQSLRLKSAARSRFLQAGDESTLNLRGCG